MILTLSGRRQHSKENQLHQFRRCWALTIVLQVVLALVIVKVLEQCSCLAYQQPRHHRLIWANEWIIIIIQLLTFSVILWNLKRKLKIALDFLKRWLGDPFTMSWDDGNRDENYDLASLIYRACHKKDYTFYDILYMAKLQQYPVHSIYFKYTYKYL